MSKQNRGAVVTIQVERRADRRGRRRKLRGGIQKMTVRQPDGGLAIMETGGDDHGWTVRELQRNADDT